ncbi:MAG: 5-oxoprolinase subunit PxpB [Holophagales bacterium]|nr:5-oxoprolinase subunit PxpB [Holophagales bacterium]
MRVAERALLVRFHDRKLERAVARAHALVARLEGAKPAVRGEWNLGAGNVLLLCEESGRGELSQLESELGVLAAATGEASWPTSGERHASHEIPVDYGGVAGDDLDEVASRTGLSRREVIAIHAAATYVVAFVGFSPGFPYLLGLPRALQLPRRASPRARVPRGAVAIAGPFAGVYPSPTPGGWHLLGSTDAVLFDSRRTPPNLLAPGDRVRFVPRSAP